MSGRRLGVLAGGLALLASGLAISGQATEMVRTKTCFNLAGSVRGYLALEGETGLPAISKTSSQSEAGTYWEIRAVGKHRGYRSHMLVSRGDSRFNGQFLAVNPATGELMMTDDRDAEEVKWLVRYAGRFEGYDAWYIQLLGETAGGFDLSYLAVDAMGQVRLERELSPSVHWRLRPSPDLPSEVIR
ncbi:MAG: hypothetical protein J5I93_19850 [Pirellulaceae bacterium]|nr:hypothetical protein [Pirellulaceae bacterium]